MLYNATRYTSLEAATEKARRVFLEGLTAEELVKVASLAGYNFTIKEVSESFQDVDGDGEEYTDSIIEYEFYLEDRRIGDWYTLVEDDEIMDEIAWILIEGLDDHGYEELAVAFKAGRYTPAVKSAEASRLIAKGLM